MLNRCFPILAAAVLVFAVAPSPAQSAPAPQWVGTWSTAPMLADGGFNVRPFSATTLREIVHISVGGAEIRVRFSNALGTDPLAISDAHVALSAGNAAIQKDSDHAITFGGMSAVSIPPGAELFSDPIALAVQPLSDLAISFYLPSQVMRAETYHNFGDQDNFIAAGDVSTAPDMPDATKVSSWYFLDGVDVRAVEGSRAIVALGDSITDGAHATHNANLRWPDDLAARLNADPKLKNVSVLNEGIGGNRVLNEVAGPSALSRLDRDVLSQSDVRYVVVLESINDIGRLARLTNPYDDVTAQMLEMGLKQIADQAHEHGIKAIGATLTPYGGAGYSSDKGEQVREDVNTWIRTSGVFDAVADFDKATQDPANPKQFNPAYDCGDHLHPNDAGYKAMADSIDLAIFGK
ncbi:MAG TPA: SGNH/GDSL hydrolase family protein [Terracidiphilus sp.]|nr:SGNH/GDSL hydrolase family protein [Terracidiphilus sp.]